MVDVSQQVKDALSKRGKSSSDIANWLGIGIRAAQKKLKEGTWKASDLSILSEKLSYYFDVNTNSDFVVREKPAEYHSIGRQPIQLNITLQGKEIDSSRISDFLARWDEMVKEFEQKI